MNFVKLYSTLPSIIHLPYVACKLPLRLVWLDLVDLDKSDISWSKLLDYGRFTYEILSLMTIQYIQLHTSFYM